MVEFIGYVSWPVEAKLEVIEPEKREIRADVMAFSANTPPEGIEGELLFVSGGGPEYYKDIDAEGKITLSELSYSPPRPVKVKVAQEHGAIGHVIRGWGPPEYEVISKSEAKWVWGNPTIDDMDDFPKIPALLITKKDGLYLEELTKKGKVRVRLKARVNTGWRKLIMPVTTIEGKEEPEKFILVGGHYDSWGLE